MDEPKSVGILSPIIANERNVERQDMARSNEAKTDDRGNEFRACRYSANFDKLRNCIFLIP